MFSARKNVHLGKKQTSSQNIVVKYDGKFDPDEKRSKKKMKKRNPGDN